MITRFRFESIADNQEDVDQALDEAVEMMLVWLSDTQPDDEWNCTDREIVPILKNGQAVVYGRRVFRGRAKEAPDDN